MRRFDYLDYSENEHVIVSENGMTFFYNVVDDSGWWGLKAMMSSITMGSNREDVFGFSSDGLCEFNPGSSASTAYFLGN